MRNFVTVMAGLMLVCAAAGVMASDEDAAELKYLTVQNRQHSITHEFTGWFGTLPLDAFTKGMTFSGAYTLHFNDVLAWEVGQFTYSKGIDTDLKEDLKNLEQPTAPTPFEVAEYYVTSSVMFKPIYMKMAVLNTTVLYGEMFFNAGGGYGWMTITKRPVISYGGGWRFYFGKVFSLRIDVRDTLWVNKSDVQNELWVALGAAVGF